MTVTVTPRRCCSRPRNLIDARSALGHVAAGSEGAQAVGLDEVQRRLCLCPAPDLDLGQSVNVLIEAGSTNIGRGAAYLDCLVLLAPKR